MHATHHKIAVALLHIEAMLDGIALEVEPGSSVSSLTVIALGQVAIATAALSEAAAR